MPTYNIPTDYPDLQTAFDALYPSQGEVVININAGYSPTSGLLLENKDFSSFRIVSTSMVVLASTFPLSKPFIAGAHCEMPVLEILVDAVGRSASGVHLSEGSVLKVLPGCGVINAFGNGMSANSASIVHAKDTRWTGCAQNGSTAAGITSWGATVFAEEADVSDSGYYGAQGAHGGILSFRKGKATGCARYGVRATDAGIVDADESDASGAGKIGYYAFNASTINARSAKATGCGTNGSGGNVAATQGSTINAAYATLAPGGIDYSAWCSASELNLQNAETMRFNAQNSNDIKVSSGGIIRAHGSNGGTNVSRNTISQAGIIFG